MCEPFFIETSKGIINRNEISYIDHYTQTLNIPAICIFMSNRNNIILQGVEAKLFLLAIPVKLIVGENDFDYVRDFNNVDHEDEKDETVTEEEEDTIPF